MQPLLTCSKNDIKLEFGKTLIAIVKFKLWQNAKYNNYKFNLVNLVSDNFCNVLIFTKSPKESRFDFSLLK